MKVGGLQPPLTAVRVYVRVTGSGLTFDAPLHKGSTHLVTHVTHGGICESFGDQFKDNRLRPVSHEETTVTSSTILCISISLDCGKHHLIEAT